MRRNIVIARTIAAGAAMAAAVRPGNLVSRLMIGSDELRLVGAVKPEVGPVADSAEVLVRIPHGLCTGARR